MPLIRVDGYRGDQTRDTDRRVPIGRYQCGGLILPCSLIDLKFDTDLLGLLMQAMLAGVALALIVAVWSDQEEYLAMGAGWLQPGYLHICRLNGFHC